MNSLPKFIVPQQSSRKENRIKRLVSRISQPKFAFVFAAVLFASAGTAPAASHPQRVSTFRAAWNQVLSDAASLPSDVVSNFEYTKRVVVGPLDSLSELATSILVGEKHGLDIVSAQLAVKLRYYTVAAASALADGAQPFLVDVPDYSLVSATHTVGPGLGHRTLASAPRGPEVLNAPQVLGTSTPAKTEPPVSVSISYIQNLIQQTFQSMFASGLLTGPKGDKGDSALTPGFSGPNGMVQNGNGQTTSVIGGTPIVTYVPSAPTNNFHGSSLAGFTDLSANSFNSNNAVISGNLNVSGPVSASSLSVSGNATVSGTFNAATSTLAALTVNGPTTFSGSTTIAGLTVTGLNPGLTQGSVAFQGAAGLSQDNANFLYDSTNHRLGLGTTTPSQPLTVASTGGNSAFFAGSVGIGGQYPFSFGRLLVNVGTNQNLTFRSGTGGTPRIEAVNDAINANIPMEFFATQYSFVGTGNLGIGNTAPSSTLAVLGGVAIGDASYTTGVTAPSNGLIVKGNVGIGTASPAVSLDVNGTARASIQDKGGQVYNVLAYGLECDGTTDDTSALNALLTTVYNAGGGTILFPAAAASNANGCVIAGQITLPNNGQSVPSQPAIRLTGTGWNAAANGSAPGTGGAILTMTYSGGGAAKLVSLGTGGLEIDHLVFRETNAGTATPFVFVTNTTLHAHDNAFYGATANVGTNCVQDVFIFGGTGVTVTGTTAGMFQGYGTVIKDNFADHIRRFTLLQSSANNIVFDGNTVWSHSGSGLAGGAAFDATSSGNSSLGNIFTNNIVEVTGYPYAFRATSNTNQFIGNGIWDVGNGVGTNATTLGAYYTSGGGNIIIDGHDDFLSGGTPFVGGTGSNIVLETVQGGIFTWFPYIQTQKFSVGAQVTANCGTPNLQSNMSGAHNVGLCFSQDAQEVIFNAQGSTMGVGINKVVFPNTTVAQFLNGTDMLNSTADLGLARNAAGVLEVNNGTAGTYRDLQLRSINPTSGNVGMGTTTPTLGPLVMASGAFVTAGGTWTNASDRNLKENFATLTPASILKKINQLPVTEWNYKTEGPTVNHIGPVAQDFWQAFHLGNSQTSISTIDPAGVALLGIQALNQKIAALQGSLNGNASTSNLSIYDPTNFSSDSVGQVEILPGQTSARVTFKQPYRYQPIVTFSPEGAFTPAFITEKDSTGFTLEIPNAAPTAATFDWHSFASPDEQLTVSDGSTRPVTLTVTSQSGATRVDFSPPSSPIVGTSTPGTDSDSGEASMTASSTPSDTGASSTQDASTIQTATPATDGLVAPTYSPPSTPSDSPPPDATGNSQ